MSKLKQYQESYLQASQQAAQKIEKPKIGAGHVAAMGRMGLDELGHATRAFHDADTVPVISEPGAFGEPTPQEVFADKLSVESPLQAVQKDLYTPKVEKQQEMER